MWASWMLTIKGSPAGGRLKPYLLFRKSSGSTTLTGEPPKSLMLRVMMLY